MMSLLPSLISFLSWAFHLLSFSLPFPMIVVNKRGLGFRNTYPAGFARELVLFAIIRSPQPAVGPCLPGRETPVWMRAYAIRQRPRGHDRAEPRKREEKRDKRAPFGIRIRALRDDRVPTSLQLRSSEIPGFCQEDRPDDLSRTAERLTTCRN